MECCFILDNRTHDCVKSIMHDSKTDHCFQLLRTIAQIIKDVDHSTGEDDLDSVDLAKEMTAVEAVESSVLKKLEKVTHVLKAP